MSTSQCKSYMTPELCNSKFYNNKDQPKAAGPYNRTDPKHRNMRKGDNPEIIAALSRHVIRSRHNALNKELNDCRNNLSTCAFTPCIGCDETGTQKSGITVGPNNMYSTQVPLTEAIVKNSHHMQVQQHFSNAGTGTNPDITVHQRSPADNASYWEGGEDHGQRQKNIFQRYVQRNARSCNQFNNQCGLLPKSVKNQEALELPVTNATDTGKLLTKIYNTFDPTQAMKNARLMQTRPSWATSKFTQNTAKYKTNKDGTRTKSRNVSQYKSDHPTSDRTTLGYED